ncbi:MAG: molybdopterin molybdotransferase MoeA, partial [Nocardioidaceae bacterium]
MASFLMPGDRLSSVDEHVERIVEALDPLPPYDQPLLEALGLPVCEDIAAPIDLPGFDNSAMDGYAVYFDDVVTASADHPVHLPVVGEMAAGQTRLFALSPGTSVRIMTGAPIPQGCDAVVPVEWTDGGVATVRITQAPTRGQHLRYRGEDVQTGDILLEDGSVLGPRQLGLLASVGRAQVRSRPRPRIVILSTGSELREPGTPLGHDSV